MPSPPRSESELLEASKSGDARAFEAVLLPHLPMLLAYSRAICGDGHLAEDVVQETALIAFRNITHLFPEADFASWLKAIARRQALSQRRSSARLKPVQQEALEAAYADPSPRAVEAEREALKLCLERLADRSRLAVRGHYFEGLPLAQIAKQLNSNLNTVKTLLFRARAALSECVKRHLKLEGSGP